MASSITLKSSSYDGRYMKLVCEQTSTSSANNTSTIKWTLTTEGGNENYYSTGPTTVKINGTTVYSKSRVAWDSKTFPASKGSTSGTLTVTHTTDGTKSISVSLSTAIHTSSTSTKTETWTLDSIPRYAKITQFSVARRDETSVIFYWAVDVEYGNAWYSTNDGSTWAQMPNNHIVTGLSANTSYKFKLKIRRKDNLLDTISETVTQSTYDYPYCTESPNFVLGDAVTLKFYNPLNRTFKFYIIGNGIEIDEDYDCSGTSYYGVSSTSTSVPYLYATIPNAKSGRYKVKVVYGSSTKTRDNGNTFSINESVCKPTFTNNFTLKDVGSKTASITNGAFLIKGYSSLTVEIPASAQMQTKYSATPDYYTASFNGTSKPISYSSTGATSCNFGVVNGTGNKTISVGAYDSRTLSTFATKDITIYDYYKPKAYIDVKRINNFGETATLNVTGNYSSLVVGGSAKNTITACKYRYKQKNAENWSDWTTLTTTLNSSTGTFTCSAVELKNLDNNSSYDFEVEVTDSLDNTTTEKAVLNEGQGIFFISSNLKRCFVNGDEILTLNKAYPVGSVYCNSTNTNPSEKLGGTWTLIDKGFTTYAGNSAIYFSPATNVTVSSCAISRSFGTIRIRLLIVVNTTLSDTGMLLGNFVWSEIGITALPFGYYAELAHNDGANGGIVYSVDYDTGNVNQTDLFNVTSMPSGRTFSIDLTFSLEQSRMLDKFCDKFYWKRTA